MGKVWSKLPLTLVCSLSQFDKDGLDATIVVFPTQLSCMVDPEII